MKFREVFDGRLGSSNIFLILQRIPNQSRPVIDVLLNSWMKIMTKENKKTKKFLKLKAKTKLIFSGCAFLTLRYESPIISLSFSLKSNLLQRRYTVFCYYLC